MPTVTPAEMTTSLWPTPVDLFPFSPLTSSLTCSAKTYSIVSDPAIQAGLSVKTTGGTAIRTQMTLVSQVGSWPIKVRGCITLGNGEKKCKDSNTVTLHVQNPCVVT